MPFVRIDTYDARPDPAASAAFGKMVYDILLAISGPEQDRIQASTGKHSGELVYGGSRLGIERSDGFVAIQVTLDAGRTLAQKRELQDRIADALARNGVRREDIFVNMTETAKEQPLPGSGEAQNAADS
jgi:4-oxalocrotonate tautomerase